MKLKLTQQQDKKKQLTLFALTWPIFIEMLLHMLMGNADTFMLSQYSDDSVAAVGVANQIAMMINIMFNFIAAGTTVIVAQHIGAEQMEEAHKSAGTSLTMNLMIGIVLSFVLVIISEPALRMVGIEDKLMHEAKSYLVITGSFMFVQALLLTLSAILKSHGFTRDTMNVTIGMNVINVIGNYLFIFGPFGIPVLGVTGVAIATVVSRVIGFIVMLILVYRKVKLPFMSHYFKPVKEHVLGLLRIGVPSAGENLSFNIMNLVMTSFIAILGTTALVTRVYSMNLMYFIMLISIAIGQGTQILVARMAGAGQLKLAYKRGINSLILGMSSSLLVAVLFNLIGEQLLGIFTDDPNVISLGMSLLLLSLILEPGRAFNIVLIASLRAVGDVRFPVYMAIISMWGVCVPVGYLLGIHFELGLVGIFIGFILDEWLRGLFMLWRWRQRKWMRSLRFRPSNHAHTDTASNATSADA